MKRVFLGKIIEISDHIFGRQRMISELFDLTDDILDDLSETENFIEERNFLEKKHYQEMLELLRDELVEEENIDNHSIKDLEQYCHKKHFFENWCEELDELNEETIDEETLDELHESLLKEDMIICDIYCEIVEKEKGCKVYGDKANIEMAESLVNDTIDNYKSLSKEEITERLVKCMELDCLNEKIYGVAIALGDRDRKIQNLAEELLIYVDNMKEKYLESAIKAVRDALSQQDIEKLETAKKRLIELENYYGYGEEDSETLEELHEELAEVLEQGEKDDTTKSFEFLNYRIEFTRESVLYNELYGEYQNEAIEKTQMLSEYYSNAYDIDAVARRIEDWGNKLITLTAQKMLSDLGKAGIYTIDMDTLNNEYSDCIDFATWQTALEHFAEEYAKCSYSDEQMKLYREQRKANRGKFVGGGFGVSGALKGSIQAGTLNVATGAVHSIANSIGNMISDAHIAEKKRRMYADKKTINELCQALYITIFSIQDAFIEILEDEEDIEIERPSDEDSARSDAIINNIKGGRCLQNQIAKALADSVILNPYNRENYELALSYFGDSNGQIEEIAKYFYVDLKQVKQKIMDDFIDKTDNEILYAGNAKNTEFWNKKKEELRKKEEWLGYISTRSKYIISRLDDQIETGNSYQKIANGQIYPTVEKADSIRKDLDAINKIVAMGLSKEEIKSRLDQLTFENEEIQEQKEVLAERREKIIEGDADAVDYEVARIKLEVMELPCKIEENASATHDIKEYFNNHYYDKTCHKFETAIAKVNKAIKMQEGERLIAWITNIQGLALNTTGFVITNKKLYYINLNEIEFSAEWSVIDKIEVTPGKYIVYTTDAKIFSRNMQDIDSEYLRDVLNNYFSRICSIFNKGKSLIPDQKVIDDVKIKEMIEPLKSLLISIYLKYANQYKGQFSLLHTFGDDDFEEVIEKEKVDIGSTLKGEIPLILCNATRKLGTGLLITNKRLYWYNTGTFKKYLDLSQVKQFITKRRLLVVVECFAILTNGSEIQLSEADVFNTNGEDYRKVLELALGITQKIDEILK